ncbi:hypothetical protein [Levilactobacillus acidifarinae]|uniref:Uncharacterized protein n=1 Tax=Levilactobacillus acidifarinae DSM 19394 = JCM 15949 TaxID=1423715 RepID=A0A0R1LJA9_9LACO|nr:hypothetical protein [Levilactobacillus acidifarinae]KRK95696.1 hypothetical protein FD25_GL000111 [Levilactobacillus acidifarinae DSM 19394]GEO69432.1 hypothetical protein LAC03_13420 [Levilactobacillus acidifarinae]
MRFGFNGTFYKNFYFWLGVVFLMITVLENVYLNVAYNIGGVGAGLLFTLMGVFSFSGKRTRN